MIADAVSLSGSQALSDEASRPRPGFFQVVSRGRSLAREGISLDGLSDLARVAALASVHGWDGEGAVPVRESVIAKAALLLHLLPTGTPPPDIDAAPDGEITISWDYDKAWVLALSIGPDGRVSFAGRFDLEAVRGRAYLFDEMPVTISTLIKRIAARGPEKR
jgi:hypothetical protein